MHTAMLAFVCDVKRAADLPPLRDFVLAMSETLLDIFVVLSFESAQASAYRIF